MSALWAHARGPAAIALAVLLASCGARARSWPFPPAAAPCDDACVLATLRDRVAGVRSLYAVLSLAFESPERNGVLDAVVRYKRPGRVRITAFKDLLVSARGVFDLILEPERFDLALEGESGAERHEGPLRELPERHPGFRGIALLGETVFLPGFLAGAAPEGAAARVERREEKVLVTVASPGTRLEWTLDAATLGVERALLRSGDAEVTVEYLGYRKVQGRYLPEAFRLRDAAAGIEVAGVLTELELNPELRDEELEREAGRP